MTASETLNVDSTDYYGNLTAENGEATIYNFGGGYCTFDGACKFHYFDRDHQGNVRAVVGTAGTVEQIMNYYPFGAPYCDNYYPFGAPYCDNTALNPDLQPYKYNGKEFETMHGRNAYDYGARFYDPLLPTWDRMDLLCEKYYHISPYAYCANDPVNAVDLDGRDWYEDDDETIQFDPNIHSQNDLQTGQKYLGETYSEGKGNVFYRRDGSIMFKNETSAYRRMWNQANVHYREQNKRGREVGGFILDDGRVLVMPDYENDDNTSYIGKYGYRISKDGYLSHGTEQFKIKGQIHTHQNKAYSAAPSTLSNEDAGISMMMGGLPVFTMGHDNMVHGLYYDTKQNGYADIPSFSLNYLWTKGFSFYDWIRQYF